jgi:peptidoglycan/LPS O-acetylase OafA/YrhL
MDVSSSIGDQIDRRLPPNQAHLKYRPDIDGLRAIAVIPVIFYHYSIGCPGGYVGVDVFYVISGYLITKIIYDLTVKRNFSFVEFYERRIRRLFPALFLMLAVVTLWASVEMIWFDLKDYGASLIAATAYVSNFYFYFTTGYFMQAAETKPLLHTWSLAVEEQFYIVVPFVLLAMVRFTSSRWHVSLILGLSALSFALCIVLTRFYTPAAFYLLPPRAWELGLGGAVAIAAPAIRPRLGGLLSIGGLAMILYAVFSFSDATPFPGWLVAVPTIGTAAVLGAGGRRETLVERFLCTRPMTFVGKISYSLYLWHWPVIVALNYASGGTFAKGLIGLGVTFGFATLSWRFVELPFRERRFLPKHLFIASAITSTVAIVAGAALFLANGFPHPANLVKLLDDKRWAELRPDCHATATRASINDLCIRGASGVAPSFLLAGDSHASALSDGIFAAARAHGIAGVQFTDAGFVPLPGRRSLTSNRGARWSAQQSLTDAFTQYLTQHTELRTVIVTAFWTREATGRSYRNVQEVEVDDSYDGSGTAYNPIALRHALNRLVEMFPDREFVVVDDVPSGSAIDLKEYARTIYSGRTSDGGLSKAVADTQRASYEPVMEGLVASHQNVRYAPILARLCGPHLCPLFRRDGVPIYRDGDHLSRYGSLDLAPALSGVLG